jgi:hypothetical protein
MRTLITTFLLLVASTTFACNNNTDGNTEAQYTEIYEHKKAILFVIDGTQKMNGNILTVTTKQIQKEKSGMNRSCTRADYVIDCAKNTFRLTNVIDYWGYEEVGRTPEANLSNNTIRTGKFPAILKELYCK